VITDGPLASPAGDSAGPLSHDRQWRAGVVQALSGPGVLDLAPGYLQPSLLPVDLLRDAYSAALAEFGAAALSYGANQGVDLLRTAIAARSSAADGRPCEADNVALTAGTSHALYLVATTMAVPGQVVLLDETSYDFGRRILEDCGLTLREVPADEAGMDPAALDEAILSAERQVAFVLLTPTFHNPTGRTVGPARRRELIEVAARHGVLIVEDDAYGELGLDDDATPASLGGLAGYSGVVRLGTFAKTIGPGLRLGWLLADPAVVARFVGRGVFESGGSPNHLASLAVAVLLRDGHYDDHLGWLRSRLRCRRDALLGTLREHLRGVEIDRSGGGFFLWLRFPGRESEQRLVTEAAQAGVAVAAGSRFGTVHEPCVRLSYSFNSPEQLATAAARLADTWNG
jgi:enduracididine biosynthesis enzyme MppQ